MSANSQQPLKNYDALWKKVNDFVEKELPKSALKEARNIYTLAKKEKQDAQIIKSLVFITSLQQQIREDNEVLSVQEIEKEIGESKEPAKAILKSLLAEMYWNYYDRKRWALYDRTETVNFKKDDIDTWSIDDFHRKIGSLYLESINNTRLLQNTTQKGYDAIIIKGNVRHLRPTLYDLLAYRALEYFENDERNITKPAYAFEINQASAFDPASDFVNRKFPTNDSLSLQQKALLIYQELIRFHLKDKKPNALIDADIKRIQFVKENSTHPDKDELYFNSVNHIAHQYDNLPAAAQAWYLLAAYYNEQADKYKPHGDTTFRYSRVKTKEICEKIVAQKDSSEGRINCYNLLNQINSSILNFNIEKVNEPGKPFRVLVNYKNIPTLHLRLVQATEKLKDQLANRYDNKYWTALLSAPVLKAWEQILPATNDLQQHATEIKTDALSHGEYILIAANDKDFDNAKTVVGARLFYVSAISYINNGADYFVLDRNSGSPLKNASVQVWDRKYDYKKSKYVEEKGKVYATDANGFFRLEDVSRDNRNYGGYNAMLDIRFNEDRLFMDDQLYTYYSRETDKPEPKEVTSVYLFTDRSIYRPGQTVYFKGIVISKMSDQDNSDAKEGYTTTITLRDANYKNVDTIEVKTNEFGSFSGKFQLPKSGLNGLFSIFTKQDRGNASFRVEEYKRPKFYVDYEAIKGTYKVNDSIKVTGFAKAYAGNNIDGATVKYRVVREPRFIYPWLFRRWWQPPSSPMEITHGEIKTDRDGKFQISFKAIPDLTIDKKFEPVFDYRIYADVTDINGETRSGEKSVSVNYKSLILSNSIPSSLPADSLKKITIRTQNLNGEFVPAVATVTITKLKEENRLIRNRFWDRPDQFVMSKQEYIKYFPFDEYDNEKEYTSWEKGEQVYTATDSSREDGLWSILHGKTVADKQSFSPGFYMIEISATSNAGDEVKDVQYIELFDEKEKKLNRPNYLWTGTQKTIVEPGETAKLEIGTSADNLFLVHLIDKQANSPSKTNSYQFISLSDEKTTFSFDAEVKDRGGFGVSWAFVKHNRMYQYNQVISIPWNNKDLHIEYATYRDKTLPGSEEKWKIKISGYKNEKVAAEMLATMYDASLDQFYAHAWRQPSVWPYYYNRTSWDGNKNFTQLTSFIKYNYQDNAKYLNKQYDRLISGIYGIEEVVVVGYGGRSVAKEKMSAAPPLANQEVVAEDEVSTFSANKIAKGLMDDKSDSTEIIINQTKQDPSVQIRKNFNETAFFFPELRTDSSGAIEFSFTMPEALTKWKFMALAHTKEAAFGSSTKEIITQKELMVQPNMPRFLREGDKLQLSTKVVNLSDKELTGTAELRLFDASTGKAADGWFQNMVLNQYFTVAAGQSESLQFPVEVPYQYNDALVWRIVASAGNYSDGEENSLPVLTNRMLVTESLPLNVKGNGTKQFTFSRLLNSGESESLQHHAVTVEYTSNPAWYAVQALPYLMEYPYECAEQTWNRYYANSLATFIANSSPRIRQVFEQWKINDTAALLSNLQKNQELKAVLLEETPWVLQAKNETEQKRNIALLFDMVRMSEQLSSSFDKLKQMQSSNGGFVWFRGGPDDRYITQYIVTGIGHLQKLNAVADGQQNKLYEILSTAIPYLDNKIKEDYDRLIKNKTDLKEYSPGHTEVQYLYMRSFFSAYKIPQATQKAYNYFMERVKLTWVGQSKYMQGMIALALHRSGDTKTPDVILKSLKETSITNDELGMYWKTIQYGWFWHQMPVETHALLIEAFQEIGKDNKTVDELKTWLLKNKQTNNWQTTKATAEACYALLLQGSDWLSDQPKIEISLGSLHLTSSEKEGAETSEAGTGYFKKTISGNKVQPDMGKITVKVTQPVSQSTNQPITGASWGAVYWQYFEDLDKITTASTPLQLTKKLFIEKNTDRGPVLEPVNEGDIIKIGDKVKVRIELRVDREMEYVHMKDMRASSLEPVNVLSQYKWQGGLGYYESTKDASTNFFFSSLQRGTYVFEYPLFATHAGNFSNGVTTIQCMYAPEFTSHSEGVRITVE